MKKRNIVLALTLSLGLVTVGNNFKNETLVQPVYAATEEEEYQTKLQTEVDKKEEFINSENYKNANDAKKKIYDINIQYAIDVLNGEEVGNYKDIYNEILNAKKDINSIDTKVIDDSKSRVSLRLKLHDVEETIKNAKVTEYTEPYLQELKHESYSARASILKNDNAKSDYEKALRKLEKAEEDYKQSIIDEKVLNLQNAINDNKESAAAAKLLLENYPNTVSNIKGDLEALIDQSNELIEKAQNLIDELEK